VSLDSSMTATMEPVGDPTEIALPQISAADFDTLGGQDTPTRKLQEEVMLGNQYASLLLNKDQIRIETSTTPRAQDKNKTTQQNQIQIPILNHKERHLVNLNE
jgi:hypothetical protein